MNFLQFSSNLNLSANSFSLEESEICCLGKGLLFTTPQKFSLANIQAFADNESKVDKMIKLAFNWPEKIVRKGENAGYQQLLAFSLFHKMFSIGFFLRVVKIQDYMVQG